jgi:IS1 family transposase
VKINGERHYLWRSVDHEGEVLESFVTKRRDKKAALKFLRKSMRRHGSPNVLVTDKLRSYGAAMKEIGNAERQETGRWLNSRAENSHQQFRRRERAMLRFRRMRPLPPPKDKQVTIERALLRRLLGLGRKCCKALAYVRHPDRQPDLRVHRNRDHPDRPRIRRASALGS